MYYLRKQVQILETVENQLFLILIPGLLHSQQDRNWHKLSDVYIWIVLVVVVPTEEGTEELRTESTSTVYSSVVHITETVVHSNSYC